MKEASYDDAARLSRELNIRTEEIWKIIKGLRYSNPSEMSLAVHKAFRVAPSQRQFPRDETQ